jgi:hypothetical protein
LLDHLVWLIVLHSGGPMTMAEAVLKVKDEIPCLMAVDSLAEVSRSDDSD